jgi:trans-aconitate methyltransferase
MTLDIRYFDDLYAGSADPYGFAARWYERRKYTISLAMLPRERYRDAFEPGCSIGVLTESLARRCDRLLACDAAAAAVRRAADRTAALPNVSVRQRVLPRDWPPGQFDLLVFSELLYYFSDEDLETMLARGVAALRPEGTLLAVHWRHEAAHHPRTGDNVHGVLAGHPGLSRLGRYSDPDFIAEVYTPSGGAPRSVAAAGGLA